ncbi:MAG: hypothetical protein JW727_05560 [Candidatus Aenigmarchaeota archaeon]|nr:hypothetical protein [Candidatus Aenigmarchaeota archaeon]
MEEEVERILEEYGRRITELERKFENKPFSAEKVLSVKEFLLSKSPKNDVQKTLAIGYYLEKHQGTDCFNLNDIETGFRQAKEPVPGNINDKINKNIRAGCIMEGKGKKEERKCWTLTTTGERVVENNFKKVEKHD